MNGKLPTAYTQVFLLIIIISILTWILPAGKYDRVFNNTLNKEVIIANTYQNIESSPQGLSNILTSFFKGIVSAIEIIAYLLIAGGSYAVILKTKAIHTGLFILINKLNNKSIVLIPILMIIFSILGTIIGFFEEGLAFYSIIMPIVLLMGYDGIVAVYIIFLGTATGGLASILNPFSIGIGSTLAQISINEGIWYRLSGWVLCTFVSIIYVYLYAKKVRKHSNNLNNNYKGKDSSLSVLSISNDISDYKLTSDKLIIILLFMSMILSFMYGITALNWSFAEMSMVFFIIAVLSAIITKIKEDNFWNIFLNGAKSLLDACILIALVRGILVIAQDGNIIDTILYYLNFVFNNVSAIYFVVINQVLQIIIGCIITSNSGQTVLTLPILMHLCDILNVPISTIITSIQYGNGLASLISPASASLLASLSIAKISYYRWLKFIMPILVMYIIIIFTVTILSVIHL